MKDQTLLQIANCLSINVQKLKYPGLLEGKMGVAVFLYHYARYSGIASFRDIADNLIDEIIDSISMSQMSFSNGLSGIGWGMKHLLKEQFIHSDDDILLFFKRQILNYIKDNEDENMLDGFIFLTLGHPKLVDDFVMSIASKKIPLFLSSGSHSLSTLNKILAIANNLPKKHIHPWYDILLNDVNTSIKDKQYKSSDLMICKELLDNFHDKEESPAWKILYDCCDSLLPAGISQADHVKVLWQKLVFLDGSMNEWYDTNWISTLVANKIKDLYIQDLYLSVGLPAFGMEIMLCNSVK